MEKGAGEGDDDVVEGEIEGDDGCGDGWVGVTVGKEGRSPIPVFKLCVSRWKADISFVSLFIFI